MAGLMSHGDSMNRTDDEVCGGGHRSSVPLTSTSDSSPQVISDTNTKAESVEVQSQPSQSDHELDDEDTLKFMDSLDNYMTLVDSLSSALGQGWLQLASARHSMGASRINSALLNLKPHKAATKLQVTQNLEEPQFTLCKWSSCEDTDSEATEDGCDDMPKMFEKLTTDDKEKNSSMDSPALDDEQQVGRERLKSLAVFGALVPPRIRDSQLSFEKAMEILVDIANARSSMLCAFSKLQKES